jgi:hypothetical protein
MRKHVWVSAATTFFGIEHFVQVPSAKSGRNSILANQPTVGKTGSALGDRDALAMSLMVISEKVCLQTISITPLFQIF